MLFHQALDFKPIPRTLKGQVLFVYRSHDSFRYLSQSGQNECKHPSRDGHSGPQLDLPA